MQLIEQKSKLLTFVLINKENLSSQKFLGGTQDGLLQITNKQKHLAFHAILRF